MVKLTGFQIFTSLTLKYELLKEYNEALSKITEHNNAYSNLKIKRDQILKEIKELETKKYELKDDKNETPKPMPFL